MSGREFASEGLLGVGYHEDKKVGNLNSEVKLAE